MTTDHPLILRCDASVSIGTGHVMRCLALAQAWQDAGGDAVFVMAQSTPAIEERLREYAVTIETFQQVPGSVEDAQASIEAARACGAKWIVVDGYQFGADYQKGLKKAGLKVLFVDDTGHAEHYLADLVLNQNAHAIAEMYRSRGGNTRLLLGPRYALLRREFASQRNFRREIPAIGRKVLVTMGGSDPENLTSRVIEALTLIEMPELEAVVVAGGSNPHLESLRAATARLGAGVRLLSNVDNMAEWMIWADVAVSAAGTICWEMCLLGLPSLLIDIAPNQTPVAEKLHRLGAAIHFGNAANAVPKTIAASLQELILSKESRATISRKAAELVDGRGAERVVEAIRGHGLRVRAVEQKDCRLLWEWANDPVVRQASFHSAPILWDEHWEWFTNKLQDPKSVMYIGENCAGVPVGHVRFNLDPERAVISVVVAPEFRGKGWGRELIWFSMRTLILAGFTGRIEAFVKPDNQASIRLFESTGFRKVGSDSVACQPALLFTWDCVNDVHAD
jgi:UDP-2,4-diacetamido-2,4,6-trideoxy-beta-L-altropyranose hydrolase